MIEQTCQHKWKIIHEREGYDYFLFFRSWSIFYHLQCQKCGEVIDVPCKISCKEKKGGSHIKVSGKMGKKFNLFEVIILLCEIVFLLSLVFLIFFWYNYSWEYFLIGGASLIIIIWRMIEFKEATNCKEVQEECLRKKEKLRKK